jgi:hypothetical protein
MNLILGLGRGRHARHDRVQPGADAVLPAPPLPARAVALLRPRVPARGPAREGDLGGRAGLQRLAGPDWRRRPGSRRGPDWRRRPDWRRGLDWRRGPDWRRGLDWRRYLGGGPGLDGRRIAMWYAAFAGYAGLVAVLTRHADQSWAFWAVGSYLLAAITAVLLRTRGRDVAVFIGAAGALAGPLAWLAIRWPATSDVQVVGRAGTLLLQHGSPYLASAQLSAWRSYDPYLPAMSVFGLVRGAGVSGVLGDSRLWLAVVCAVLLAVAFGVAAPHHFWRCARCRHEALRRAAFALTTPLLALPLAVGITDPPVLVLFCVALACVGTSPAAAGTAPVRPGLRWPPVARAVRPSPLVVAALAIGVACAMKLTAWPALPVIAVMVAARDGRRAAWRFAAMCGVTVGAAIAATAPRGLIQPVVLLQNTILYPLGLTRQATPAASPLPGHLLAATGTAGHWAAIGLLLAAGLAVAVQLVRRRPADARAAAWRLALGLAIMFALTPATRWGYFAYPLGLLGWLILTGHTGPARGRAAVDGSGSPRVAPRSGPEQADPAVAMAGAAACPGAVPAAPAAVRSGPAPA